MKSTMTQVPQRDTPVPDYLKGYDPVPAKPQDMIGCEYILGASTDQVTLTLVRLMQNGAVENEHNLQGPKLVTYVQSEVRHFLEQVEQTEKTFESSDSAESLDISTGMVAPATVMRMAVRRFCMVRAQIGTHSVGVHIDWEDTNNVHVSQGSTVQVRIKGAPSGQHNSYTGELVPQ